MQGPAAVAAKATADKEKTRNALRGKTTTTSSSSHQGSDTAGTGAGTGSHPADEEKGESERGGTISGQWGTSCGYDYEGGRPGDRYLRRGPVDASEEPAVCLTSSEFANVYLSENRALLLASVALSMQLDDMRSALFAVLANAAASRGKNDRAITKEEEDAMTAERLRAVQELLDEQVVVSVSDNLVDLF